VPRLLGMVASGAVDPLAFITQHEEPANAIEAYETFDRREEGWLKTVLDVSA
jgi:threonine dehydrogenase-like Zn-dependent dehydrogenase